MEELWFHILRLELYLPQSRHGHRRLQDPLQVADLRVRSREESSPTDPLQGQDARTRLTRWKLSSFCSRPFHS